MVSYEIIQKFISEVNISGNFNGNLYMNSQEQVGESYVADITWQRIVLN